MSGGELEWDARSLKIGLRDILRKAQRLDDDIAKGARVVLDESQQLVPKEDGRLASRAEIKRDRGGNNTVAIVYDSPYARWIHEHLHFKHPHGGQAKFLEQAMLTKGAEAMNKAGESFWGRL